MKTIPVLCSIILCFAITSPIQAKKKTKRIANPDFTLVEAYTQRTLPGRPHRPALPTTTHLIIVWEGKVHPDAFFWYADTSLLQCSIVKAHKIVNRYPNAPRGIEYYTENTVADAIEKGDTIDVIPISNSHAKVADGISYIPNTQNTLISETSGQHGSNVHWLQIGTIAKKRDILMP